MDRLPHLCITEILARVSVYRNVLLWATLMVVCCIFYGTHVFFQALVLHPSKLRRALRKQGLKVRPFRPFAGDLPELTSMKMVSQKHPLPSPNDHHLLFEYLYPFYNKLLSNSQVTSFDLNNKPNQPTIFWFFNQPTLILTDPHLIKLAYASDIKHFRKPIFTTKLYHRLFGSESLILAEGNQWHGQRNIIRPAFYTDKIKEMVVKMAISASEMVAKWNNIITQNSLPIELDIVDDLKGLTADILARTSFGSNFIKGRSVFEKQVEVLDILMKHWVQHIVIPGYRYLPTSANRKLNKLEKEMNKELYEIVESRRKSIYDKDDKPQNAPDLLGLILLAEDREIQQGMRKVRLTTKQVLDECKTFFFAGHETTSNLLSWTMVMLSLDQDWQEKARQEVFEVCGKNGRITIDHVNKFKIIGMILYETLRLYPPVCEQGFRSLLPNDKELNLGGVNLPVGSGITIPTVYIHRRKDIWGDDADQFNPQRFSNGVANACKNPYAFLPFGQGPRICIGNQFAMMEAKVVVATIIQMFRFKLSPNYKHAPVVNITLRPKHGVQVIFEPL